MDYDKSLLLDAIALQPELLLAVNLVACVRTKLTFPVEELAAIKQHADGVELIDGNPIPWEEVERRVPQAFFPITDERDLLTKVYLAIKLVHLHQRGEFDPDRARAFAERFTRKPGAIFIAAIPAATGEKTS